MLASMGRISGVGALGDLAILAAVEPGALIRETEYTIRESRANRALSGGSPLRPAPQPRQPEPVRVPAHLAERPKLVLDYNRLPVTAENHPLIVTLRRANRDEIVRAMDNWTANGPSTVDGFFVSEILQALARYLIGEQDLVARESVYGYIKRLGPQILVLKPAPVELVDAIARDLDATGHGAAVIKAQAVLTLGNMGQGLKNVRPELFKRIKKMH